MVDRTSPDARQGGVLSRFASRLIDGWRRLEPRDASPPSFEARYRRLFETPGVSFWEQDFTEVKRALDALRAEGVSDWRAYFEEHPEFVDRCIRAVKIIDVNDATVRMFAARDKRELLTGLGEVFVSQTRSIFIDELVALAEGRTRFEAEVELKTLHGERRHTIVAIAFPAEGESFASVIVSLTDITARKQSEDALQRSERLFRSMADTAPAMLWTTNREGQCTFLSRGWYEYTGRPPDSGLGVGWLEAVHPDDRASVIEGFAHARQRGDSVVLEYRLRSAEGEHRWVLDAGRPRRRENGDLDGYIGSIIDIHERRQAEQALKDEVDVRQTLARIGASLARELDPDKLVQAVTDAGTTLTSAEFGAFFYNVTNDAGESYMLYTLSGAPREAFEKFPMPRATSLFGPTFRGEGVVRIDDVMRDPRYGQNPPYHGMPPGHLPVRSYLAVPVLSRSGEVVGGLFFGHSSCGVFTARHEQLAVGVAAWAAIALNNARLYRDLEEAGRMKDEFLATLSHELRTPLNAILGWSYMLRSGGMQPDIQERALEALERNARAQAQLIDDLLDVSRIVSGKLAIRSEEVDLARVVAAAVDSVRPAAAARRLHLRVKIEAPDAIVTGDSDRLQQVVWNLLSNALKFTPAGGRVEIELMRRDSRVEIVVRDTGQGIDRAFLPHVFERFRQADSSTARRHGGLGLGLSIVKHLVEAHGGTVAADSAGPGQGAVFIVRLPVRAVTTSAPHVATPEPDPKSSVVLAGRRALVVDDEPDARDLIRYVLESSGARVTTAASAGEALHLATSQRFDLLVADIGMPDKDGYWLVRALRALPDEHVRSMAAVAVTAYASLRERDRALAEGYDRHVPKPIDPAQLVAVVSSLLESAARR